MSGGFSVLTHIEHTYRIECWRAGKLLWSEDFKNLVTTVGKNKYLDATLVTGSGAPTWFIGLVLGPGGGNTYAAADTMAAHAGWAESTDYSEATRVAWVPGAIAAGSVDSSASPAQFTINVASVTIAGGFMVNNSTKAGATGTLLGVGNFVSGDRALLLGDLIRVTVTATIT